VLALVEKGLWLDNARAANAAAQEIGAAAGERLLHAVESNQLFFRTTREERAALRAQGFAFYDWGQDAARVVTPWDSDAAHVTALARAVAGL
jgi:threonine aldolase